MEKYLGFSDDFRRNRSQLIRLNSIDIKSEIGLQFLSMIIASAISNAKLLQKQSPKVSE